MVHPFDPLTKIQNQTHHQMALTTLHLGNKTSIKHIGDRGNRYLKYRKDMNVYGLPDAQYWIHRADQDYKTGKMVKPISVFRHSDIYIRTVKPDPGFEVVAEDRAPDNGFVDKLKRCLIVRIFARSSDPQSVRSVEENPSPPEVSDADTEASAAATEVSAADAEVSVADTEASVAAAAN